MEANKGFLLASSGRRAIKVGVILAEKAMKIEFMLIWGILLILAFSFCSFVVGAILLLSYAFDRPYMPYTLAAWIAIGFCAWRLTATDHSPESPPGEHPSDP